ncbi:MAG: hypothetical protein RL150_503 [Candidatus Parcubacteria bacterium]
MLLNVVVFGMIATGLVIALTSWFAVTWKGLRYVAEDEQAFHIAEAGIEYYRWHLAHAPNDFKDGTNNPGPYVHPFKDAEGNVIGSFSLEITPPATGSTLVTITSTGTVEGSSAEAALRVELAKPSFAKYAFVANDEMRFGEGTEVFGPIHSNDGIRFDGLAHNLISSARESYDDPDHSGPNEWAVHTHVSPVDPNYPTTLPDRFDVFEAGRQVAAPAVDFAGLTADLAALKALAQTAEGRYFGSSGNAGYHVVLGTNDKFTLYRVRSQQSPHSSCTNVLGQDDWNTWSIRQQTLIGTYNFPANGVIFLEDHVWVSGQINTARLTIAAARFPDSPSTRRNIIITNDITYTNNDGQDVLALIAQKDVNIGMYSDTSLQIDAALVAQNGRVGRHYYRGPQGSQPGCSPYHTRSEIELYGMIGTNVRYGFAYTDGNGYTNREITYDANLLYGPPPSFPLTSDQYEILTWQEL